MSPDPAVAVPDESGSLERLAWRNPGILTLAIMAACVDGAFFTLLGPADLQMARLIDAGAQVKANIAAGEWWRLLTPAFIHGGWQHLVFNLYALFVVGSLVELVLGRARFFVIYVLAAIAGSLASFPLNSGVGVGASGAIFGLFGAALVGSRMTPADWTVLSPKRWTGLATWAGYSLLAGFTTRGIDNAAHLGGLIGGVAALGLTAIRPLRSVMVAVCALALAWSGYEVVRSPKVMPVLAALIRGEAASERKDLRAAEREFGAAVPFAPALVNRAVTRVQLDDFPGALADADAALADLDGKLVQSAPPPALALRMFAQEYPSLRDQARLVRAVALSGLGRTEDAVAAADEALDTHDEDIYGRVRYIRGVTLSRMGRSSEALLDFQLAKTSKDSDVQFLADSAAEEERRALGPIRLQEILDSTVVRLSRVFTEAELERAPEIVACSRPYDGVALPGGYVELHFVLNSEGQVDSQTVRLGRVKFGGSPEVATQYILSCRYRPGLVHGLPVRTQWEQGLGSRPPIPDVKVE